MNVNWNILFEVTSANSKLEQQQQQQQQKTNYNIKKIQKERNIKKKLKWNYMS